MGHHASKKIARSAPVWALQGDLLRVINPRVSGGGDFAAAAADMVAARLAIAMRERPAEAVAIAILAAQNRPRSYS